MFKCAVELKIPERLDDDWQKLNLKGDGFLSIGMTCKKIQFHWLPPVGSEIVVSDMVYWSVARVDEVLFGILKDKQDFVSIALTVVELLSDKEWDALAKELYAKGWR